MSEYAGPVTLVKKARTSHQCAWCGQVIEKGSSYKKWLWFCDGTRNTIKAHPECLAEGERTRSSGEYIWFDGDGHRPKIKEK